MGGALLAGAAPPDISSTASTSTTTPPVRAASSSLSSRFGRMLFGRKGPTKPLQEPEGYSMAEERERWQAERRMILEDSAQVRATADELERVLGGWSALAHDLLFYGLFYGRKQQWIDKLTARLQRSVGEVEGVLELEITELRLPSSAECAPQLKLHKYAGPELSEWNISWEPPSSQAGGSIALKGRKFGVSFTIVVAVGSLKVNGLVVVRWTPEAGTPVMVVGFKKVCDMLHACTRTPSSHLLTHMHSLTISFRTMTHMCRCPLSTLTSLLPARHSPSALRHYEAGYTGRSRRR